MSRVKIIVLFFLSATLFSGCVKYYKFANKSRKIIKSSYSSIDSIYVKDYFLCNSLRDINKNMFSPKGGEVIPINEDSVLVHFRDAFNKLNIPVHFATTRINYCDSSFHENVLLNDKKVNHNLIKTISNKTNKKLVLVPFLYIDNIYKNQIYFLSSGVPAGGDLVRNSYLQIGIYILNDKEIIYFRSGKHVVISSHQDFEEEPKRQTQENWDKLVEMVMRDYIKRMK
jgi:hypothetical protein